MAGPKDEGSSAAVPDCWKATSISSSVSPGGEEHTTAGEHLGRLSTAAAKSALRQAPENHRCLASWKAASRFQILWNLSQLQFNLKRQNISLNTASKCGSFNFLNLSLSLLLLLKSLRTAILHSSPENRYHQLQMWLILICNGVKKRGEKTNNNA